MARRIIVLFRFLVKVSRIRIGASFCQVIRMRFIGHLNLEQTDGNHQWQGAMPSFRRSLRIKTDIINLSGRIVSFGWKYRSMEKINIIDPGAWLMKYFIAASDSWFIVGDIIIGINDRRFSSSPIQIMSQLEEERAIVVPVIRVEVNSRVWGRGENIKDERS